MTTDEVIAGKFGWKPHVTKSVYEQNMWRGPDGRLYEEWDVPTYRDGWKSTGDLLEDLPDKFRVEINRNISMENKQGKFRCHIDTGTDGFFGFGESRAEAFSCAWLGWQEGK